MFYLQITTVLIYGTCIVISAFLLMCLMLLICDKPYPNYKRHQKEKYFKDYRSGDNVEFPYLDDSPTVNLSVVIPAYNEEVRLPPMLDECILFLENKVEENKNFSYEIIVVSDGSRDKTVAVASEYSKKHGADKIRVLELTENRGKGGAVRLGVMSARGALILFADADGATRFSDFSKLEGSLTKYCGKNYITEPQVAAAKSAIAIGSRAHLEDESIANRSMFRTVLMYGFHFLVWLFAVRGVRDTQCGFKVFTRQAARICFTNMHVERWAFDVELLYIAQHYDIPIAEEAVYWTEIDGSKVTPLWSWLQMGGDLGLIYLRYRIGAWKLKKAE